GNMWNRNLNEKGVIEIGEMNSGKLHGWGVKLFLENGYKYVGEFFEGDRQGTGVLTWPDGRRYEGQFKEYMMHGKGVFTWSQTGFQYEGEFEDDDPKGAKVLRGCFLIVHLDKEKCIHPLLKE